MPSNYLIHSLKLVIRALDFPGYHLQFIPLSTIRPLATLIMDRLDLIQFYFDLGLKYLDILRILAVKHNIILSLASLKRFFTKKQIVSS